MFSARSFVDVNKKSEVAAEMLPTEPHIRIDVMPAGDVVDRHVFDITLGNDRFSSSPQCRRASPRMMFIPHPSAPNLKIHHWTRHREDLHTQIKPNMAARADKDPV